MRLVWDQQFHSNKQSRIIASSHSFEYIGTGVDPVNSLPSRGAVPIQDNEIDDRNGGLTIFTSTDQTGNFRIGDGVIINQQTGTITGEFYSKSLFSQNDTIHTSIRRRLKEWH